MDQFKMAPDELDLLASLKGCPLRTVVERVWGAIDVYGEPTSLALLPRESMSARNSLIRVGVSSDADEIMELGQFDKLVASDRPEVVRVEVLDVVLGSVPRERAEHRDARRYIGTGENIPVYRPPDGSDLGRESARLLARGGTELVLVDVAVVITTADHRAVTIYSDDAAFFLHAADGFNAGHVPLDIARRRSL